MSLTWIYLYELIMIYYWFFCLFFNQSECSNFNEPFIQNRADSLVLSSLYISTSYTVGLVFVFYLICVLKEILH